MKKIIALLLALVMVFALVACNNTDDEGEKDNTPTSQNPENPDDGNEAGDPDQGGDTVEVDYDNPIKIGHIADQTGNEASTGLLAVDAVQFAADLINAQGGIDGRAIEIIAKDSMSTPSTAVAMYNALVDEGVVAVVGPTQIGHKIAVAPAAAEAEVPVICYNGTPVFLTQSNEYVLSSGGGTSQMPTAMADYLYNELDCRTIYTITQEGTAGDNYVKPLIEYFEDLGGKVVEDIRVPADATDVGQYLMRVTEKADALVGWLSGTQGINLWTNWYNQGLADKMPLYGAVHGGFTDYFIWNALPDEVVEKALEWGVYAPINYAYSIDNESNAAFVEAWKEANDGAVPLGSNLPGAGYTCLSLIKNAIESLEGDITGAALYEALQNAETEVAEGHTAFAGGKVAVKDIYIVQVEKLGEKNFNYKVVDVYEDVPAEGLTVG